MSLPVDERLISAQNKLEREIMEVIAQKRQLFEQFKKFALKKLKTQGQPFMVKFRSINGDPNLSFKDLNIGDEFLLKYGNFMFDPKTNLLSNYIRIEVNETKTTEDFDELTKTSKSRPRPYLKAQQTLDNATELERSKIDREMQRRVNKILKGIFSGKLNFDDPDFKLLVERNIDLERGLQELNTRMAAVRIINNSSGLNIGKSYGVNPEIPIQDNRTAIIDFLKGFDGVYMDSTNPLLAETAPEDAKTM